MKSPVNPRRVGQGKCKAIAVSKITCASVISGAWGITEVVLRFSPKPANRSIFAIGQRPIIDSFLHISCQTTYFYKNALRTPVLRSRGVRPTRHGRRWGLAQTTDLCARYPCSWSFHRGQRAADSSDVGQSHASHEWYWGKAQDLRLK